MIYHYGLTLTPSTINHLLGLSDDVEVQIDRLDSGPYMVYIHLRSSEEFSVNTVQATPFKEMPWTPLENAIDRYNESR